MKTAQAHAESGHDVFSNFKPSSLLLSPSPTERVAPPLSFCEQRLTSFVSSASSPHCFYHSSLSPWPNVLAGQPRFWPFLQPTSCSEFLSPSHKPRRKPRVPQKSPSFVSSTYPVLSSTSELHQLGSSLNPPRRDCSRGHCASSVQGLNV